MKRVVLAVCIAVALSLAPTALGGSVRAAATTTITKNQFPTNFVFDGCAEQLLFGGTVNMIGTTTIDATGDIHVMEIFEPAGDVTVTGLTTGDAYHATGVSRFTFSTTASQLPYTYTDVNIFNIVGPGPDNNTFIQTMTHITVLADGTVTVAFDNGTDTCR